MRRHFDFLFPLKGVSGGCWWYGWPFTQGFGSEAIATFHMCNQIAIQVLVQILLKRLKSVVLNAVLNLGIKHSAENILHHKDLLIVATFKGEGMGNRDGDKGKMAFDFHIFIASSLNFITEQVILFFKRTEIICMMVL